MMIYIVTILFDKCLNYWIILILQVNNEVKRSFNKIDIFFNCLVKIVLSKDYKYYYNIFFRKDILDSLFDGYDAWIPPSFDKSKYFPPPLPIPVKMIIWLVWYIKVPVKCTWLVYKIRNVKSNEQTFLLSKEGFYLFFTKTFQKRFLINWHMNICTAFSSSFKCK